jgi:hypothetical protein
MILHLRDAIAIAKSLSSPSYPSDKQIGQECSSFLEFQDKVIELRLLNGHQSERLTKSQRLNLNLQYQKQWESKIKTDTLDVRALAHLLACVIKVFLYS